MIVVVPDGTLKSMTGNAEWLSMVDAAAEVGVTYGTFYRWVRNGQGPTVHRFGRVYCVRRTDMDRFIDSLRVDTGFLDHLDGSNY